MSFLQYQKSSPKFLNDFLKYKRFIEFELKQQQINYILI